MWSDLIFAKLPRNENKVMSVWVFFFIKVKIHKAGMKLDRTSSQCSYYRLK